MLGVKPGAELLAATEKAKEHGAKLVLADRDIQATLKRTWRNLSFLNKFRLVSVMFGAFFTANEITEDTIEELKDRDSLSDAMKEFAKAMPQVQIPLIDERDRYLMSSVQEAEGQTIVAVVGAGHVEGMVSYLGHTINRRELTVIPPPSRWTALLKWIIPAIVLAAFVVGYQKHAGETLSAMIYAWVLPNAVAAAALSLLAGAKLWTVLTAFISSPITSLNPTIGTGMVAGFVEAKLRRPTVEDAEGIQDAMMSVRGIYANRFTRVLLVAVMSSLGSSLGAWIGATWVISLL
ncbi:MAG: TraB family protein [Myxococcales bacterium]|nr:MAG: TraB family protein [Myxococcales bacterium]